MNNYYGEANPQQSRLNTFFSGTQEFMQSNSAITNFAFLIIVLIMFMILFQVSINLINYLFFPKSNVKLIDGMIDATQQVEIPQDPKINNSKSIHRSSNEHSGIEFTYTMWLYVKDINLDEDIDTQNNGNHTQRLQHVFHKGEKNINTSGMNIGDVHYQKGMNFPNNSPGVYLRRSKYSNHHLEAQQAELLVVMNSYPDKNDGIQQDHIIESVSIPNIPLQNWILVTVMVKDKNLDVYVNGNVAKRKVLSGIPKQNYGNIYAASNGGFNGNISNLTYYNKALGTRQINDILRLGPNKKMTGNANILNTDFSYLSIDWFLGSSYE